MITQLEKDIIQHLEALSAIEFRLKLNSSDDYSSALEVMFNKIKTQADELLDCYEELEC